MIGLHKWEAPSVFRSDGFSRTRGLEARHNSHYRRLFWFAPTVPENAPKTLCVQTSLSLDAEAPT